MFKVILLFTSTITHNLSIQMKTKLFYLLIILPLIIFSCSDKNEDTNPKESPIIAEFGFNNPEDINPWELQRGDSTLILIDNEIMFEGSGSLKIQNGRATIIHREGIHIEKNVSYKITLQVKNTEIAESGNAFPLGLVIVQENEQEYYSIYKDTENWHKESIYFSMKESSSPIQLKVICGTQDTWIDQLVIEKV